MAAVLESVRAFFAQSTFTIDVENAGDVVARERLLDRAMGPNRRRKSSEALRRAAFRPKAWRWWPATTPAM